MSNTRAMKSSGPTEGDAYASGLFATRTGGLDEPAFACERRAGEPRRDPFRGIAARDGSQYLRCPVVSSKWAKMGYLFGQKRQKFGRLQRQAARCFLVTPEADSMELGTWCWPRVVLSKSGR